MLKFYEAPGQFVASFEDAGSSDVENSTKSMIEKRFGTELREITKKEYDVLLPKYKNI